MSVSKSTSEMSHQEWLEDRRKGIGGSDVATVLGLNKYKSVYQLWLEKTGQVEVTSAQSEAAYWGNTLEEVVAEEFSKRTGKKVRKRNQVFEHQKYPFLRANIDRDVVGENAVLECKTANQYLANEWDEDEIPIQYICQVQHYMNVLNLDYVYFAVLIGGQKFIWKKMERDQELIDMITEKLVEFWTENVEKGIEPAIDGLKATSDFLTQRYLDTEDNQTELNTLFDEKIANLARLKEDRKIIDESITLIENELRQALGSSRATIGITPKNIVSWKKTQSKRLDKKKLIEKYPDVADDEDIYSVSTTKRLTIKKMK
ncbi:YqaJ viral recombinase family nuclease [Enterococcus cecorum]|uniref:YqaJ viral recombinase family nuclease n=1 Tax=Enterococcus cecorum TaxID=44008 RepID=UPI002ACA6579|nr:YqaJ viral recombinase family protein [Enterococcus cecorum]MDZ5503194.1 YqaJ viral recombinase family protein [Enterococcus cecorum]MDZ5557047.1 YqaJ viral recombinase family protein [Enterococcus cecorum]MDZ5559066.1 YqaJ viral recombinase family protein [Enterococcus cecorum]MDZ5592008.1 YqaJ viral recombinase family protein [Enterococcus cecorum]